MSRSLLSQSTANPPPVAPPQLLPLVEELWPVPDPWETFQRVAALPGCLFLDTAARPDTAADSQPLGRYSFITADPFDTLHARECSTDPFAELASKLKRYCMESVPGLPPFQGGAAGLFGYDLCRRLERLPPPRCDDFHVPELSVGFYDWVIAFDHDVNRAWLISTGWPEHERFRRRRRAEQRLGFVKRTLSGAAANLPATGKVIACPAPSYPVHGFPGLLSNFDRSGYQRTIERALEYIAAGDVFQVNLAQRLLRRSSMPPLSVYGRLRARNPAPFAAYLDLGEFVVLSASPERFLRVEDGAVETRPIKGTRPRSSDPEEDEASAAELLASGKDRAENIMIVDLLRNDLGRVCRYGSVQVPAVCRLESFRHVHHLVSEVRGHLRDEATTVDLLRAAFPGGSVTGAPKIRAMEIIAELEPSARGPYCGSIGYLGFDGSMDTNILIRTLTCGRGWVQFPVGGGIVADSVPEWEYEETWHKARGLVDALSDP